MALMTPEEFEVSLKELNPNWAAGQHGVATWHGAGPVMANKIMLQRVIDYEHDKNIVRQTLNIKEKKMDG